MNCKISELRDKQVVCISSGVALGPVCDVLIDTSNGSLKALVVFGRLKCFGLLGREEDIVIPWCEIKVIGPDTILVSIQPPSIKKKRRLFNIFQNR